MRKNDGLTPNDKEVEEIDEGQEDTSRMGEGRNEPA